MSERRKVLLLSAGAALDWHNAPSTKKITEAIIKGGFKNKKGEWITKRIFDKLNKGEEPDYQKVNFESIVNVIEDFIGFWSKNESNLLSNFITEDHIDWDEYIGTFNINQQKKHYELIIEGAGMHISSKLKNISNEKLPQSVYFEALLIEVFDFIVSEIDRYSYHTSTKSNIFSLKNSEINTLIENFFKNSTRGNILRVYSTNYDKVIEEIFKNSKIDFTDGFQEYPLEIPQNNRHFDANGIYTKKNEERNCIYHLHGSIFWEVISEDPNGLDYYNFFYNTLPSFSINGDKIPYFSLEKGKEIPIFNIITGYKKVTRTGLSPFRQIFSAFDRDCYKAEELIIVGYSFGDDHINDIINKARNSNRNLKIEIVDPNFVYEKFSMENIPKWGYVGGFIVPEKISDKITFYKKIGLTVYKMNFIEYLQIERK